MPRIRKETSNRRSTNDRKKVQRKVRESKKKAKKAAKSNPQWKSKTPKDPGIPNNFPFKDQILAEVSETRRLEAEEKAKRKAEKKALRSGTEVLTEEGTTGEDVEMEDEQLKGLQIGNDAIGGVGARRLVHAKTITRPSVKETAEEDDEDEVPMLINRDLSHLQAVLDEADVVIEVLDARDPLSFRSTHLEELVSAKDSARLLLLLNKIDLCPRETISAWAAQLGREHPTLPFRSSTAFLPSSEPEQKTKGKGKTKAPTGDAWGMDAVLDHIRKYAEAKSDTKPLTVAVVGVANAGKSSFVNSLLKKHALEVYALGAVPTGPTTTQLPQEITLNIAGKDVRLIDTPGFSWKASEGDEDMDHAAFRIRDVLLRAKGRVDKLKDPVPAVADIIARANAEDLMLYYKTPAFAKGDTITLLSGVARSNHLVKKHGELDIVGASRIILRDWATGAFARYSNVPGASSTTNTTQNVELGSSVLSVLERLQPRKELRKAVGLVRLTPGSIERRRLDILGSWSPAEDHSPSSDSEEESGEESLGFDDGGEMEDEDTSIEEDADEDADAPAALLPPSSNKRKRVESKGQTASKKVSFDVPSKTKAVPARKTITPKNNGASKPKTLKKAPGPTAFKTQPKGTGLGGGNDEAYDFGKFF